MYILGINIKRRYISRVYGKDSLQLNRPNPPSKEAVEVQSLLTKPTTGVGTAVFDIETMASSLQTNTLYCRTLGEDECTEVFNDERFRMERASDG